MRVCVYVCMYVCMYSMYIVCICVYTHTYIYIYIMTIIYWYEIIVVLLNFSFFYLNNIFQMWFLHIFNYFLVLYKVITLPIIVII